MPHPPGNSIAIDVLLRPDDVMGARMRALNARLREGYPEGFALDGRRIPHLTVVQRYVSRARLDEALEATAGILAREALPQELSATGYGISPRTGTATVSVDVERTATLTGLQSMLVEALAPFATLEGGDASFFRDAGEPPIDASMIEYVRSFVPDRVAERFEPHITVGRATNEDARRLEAEGFPSLRFGVAGAAVYQLGNAGTARRRLWP